MKTTQLCSSTPRPQDPAPDMHPDSIPPDKRDPDLSPDEHNPVNPNTDEPAPSEK